MAKLNQDHVTQINGKDYVLFRGLLELATAAGFSHSQTHIVQIPAADNGHLAVVRTTAFFVMDGTSDQQPFPPLYRQFTCVGDASPETTKLKAYLRMAETRALARCFRFALNIGETAFDEIEDESPDRPRTQSTPPRQNQQRQPKQQQNAVDSEEPVGCSYDGCGVVLTQGQVRLSMGKYNVPLCPAHQIAMKAETGG